MASSDIDTDLALTVRTRLPDPLRVLADAFPRADWAEHQNFSELAAFWMERHMMFRTLLGRLQRDTSALLEGTLDPRVFGSRLVRRGGLFVNELQTHHQVEDLQYFPKLAEFDARLERGFDLLEADHHSIDPMLQSFADTANIVLQGGAAGRLQDALITLEHLMDRHLTDEEDLVVPVILKMGFVG